MASTLFALDIGTRSVVGIILKEKNNSFHVADLISIEHQERSMKDGQIHNILSVASVISEIKETLEVKHGPLDRVSVAAAGRALKTIEGSMSVDISVKSLISNEDVNRLELAAVQQAQQELLTVGKKGTSDKHNNNYYYCVGYSVLHYKLDNEIIGNLIDQTGRSASVEVIATFLPQVVVESLLAALTRAGLEMEALTLEPIAAIQVLIPPSMRRLNVALVDIGAGTSDIAITDNNTVIAYGMVPLAGDEITEALSNEYLLDFPLAENIKRQLSAYEEVIIEDILGFEQTVSSTEVNDKIKPTIERLTKSISEEIRRLNNGDSPKAVILVGGGSMTPNLPKALSKHLELPENRVGIRGLEALSGVTIETTIGTSPDLVTPIGIAIAAKRAPIHYMSITLNDKAIRLFELKEMTVADALLVSNITAQQLYGLPGQGMTVSVNGKIITIPGEHGIPSTFLLNGIPASSKDLITSGDSIELIPGKDGSDASATARDLFDDAAPIYVNIDNNTIVLEPEFFINGERRQLDTAIQDRDELVVTHEKTLVAALKKMGGSNLLTEKKFTIYMDRKPLTIKGRAVLFYLGKMVIKPTHTLKDGDIITIQIPHPLTIAQAMSNAGEIAVDKISITFNDKEMTVRKSRYAFTLNGEPVDESVLIKSNDRIDLTTINKDPIVFSDIFAFTDYSLPADTSGNYQLLRNSSPIGFDDPIYGGDNLKIVFPS